MSSRPKFSPGKNIAVKVPADQFDATVHFYREILGLSQLPGASESSVVLDFDGKRLWIDRVATLSQAEVWLEISSPSKEEAAKYLSAYGIVRCDEIEPLPLELNSFWIKSPSSIVHLVSQS